MSRNGLRDIKKTAAIDKPIVMSFPHVDEFAYIFLILILNIFFNLTLFSQEPFKITEC